MSRIRHDVLHELVKHAAYEHTDGRIRHEHFVSALNEDEFERIVHLTLFSFSECTGQLLQAIQDLLRDKHRAWSVLVSGRTCLLYTSDAADE